MNIYLEAKEFILTQLSSHNPLNNKGYSNMMKMIIC